MKSFGRRLPHVILSAPLIFLSDPLVEGACFQALISPAMSERTASQTSAETAVDGGSKGDRKSKRFQWFWHPAVRNDGKQTAINTLKGLLLITVVLWTV